jgi:hypothetical protein
MPWLLIHSRDRTLLVRGVEAGAPMFTRDAGLALRFAGQAAARKWADKHIVTGFDQVALLREKRTTTSNENGAESGQEQRRRGDQASETIPRSKASHAA